MIGRIFYDKTMETQNASKGLPALHRHKTSAKHLIPSIITIIEICVQNFQSPAAGKRNADFHDWADFL